MSLGRKIGLVSSHIVLHRDPAPLAKKGQSPHVYRGQTAGWIKMPLGVEVGLGPGKIVLDVDLAPPQGA